MMMRMMTAAAAALAPPHKSPGVCHFVPFSTFVCYSVYFAHKKEEENDEKRMIC